MAYTSTDLATAQTALLSLTTGSKAQRVTIMGKTVEYAPGDISALKSLISEIQTSLGTAFTRVYGQHVRRQ